MTRSELSLVLTAKKTEALEAYVGWHLKCHIGDLKVYTGFHANDMNVFISRAGHSRWEWPFTWGTLRASIMAAPSDYTETLPAIGVRDFLREVKAK